MSTKSWDENGYLRVTSDDGRRSYLYEPPETFIGKLFGGHGDCIEVADHHKDGTTTAYEFESGFFNEIFNAGRGELK
jgi:hypothetical protein